MAKLGVMLYGRRSDELVQFVSENLATKAELVIAGALDGLNDEQVQALAAADPATGIPEYLSDGSIVFVDHEEIATRARQLANKLAHEGVDRSLMCCTAPWPSLETESHIVVPVKILEHVAVSLLPTAGTLGVIQPLEETKNEEIKHWQALGVNVISVISSPETDSDDVLAQAAESLLAKGTDVIAMDCLSFTTHHRDIVLKITGKPTLLPMTLIGRVVDEVLGL